MGRISSAHLDSLTPKQSHSLEDSENDYDSPHKRRRDGSDIALDTNHRRQICKRELTDIWGPSWGLPSHIDHQKFSKFGILKLDTYRSLSVLAKDSSEGLGIIWSVLFQDVERIGDLTLNKLKDAKETLQELSKSSPDIIQVSPAQDQIDLELESTDQINYLPSKEESLKRLGDKKSCIPGDCIDLLTAGWQKQFPRIKIIAATWFDVSWKLDRQFPKHGNQDFIFIPIGFSNHWSLLEIDYHSRKLYHYDSAESIDPTRVATVRRALSRILVQDSVLSGAEEALVSARCPQQDDRVSCGIYLLENLRRRIRGEGLPTTYDPSSLRDMFLKEAMELSNNDPSANALCSKGPDHEVLFDCLKNLLASVDSQLPKIEELLSKMLNDKLHQILEEQANILDELTSTKNTKDQIQNDCDKTFEDLRVAPVQSRDSFYQSWAIYSAKNDDLVDRITSLESRLAILVQDIKQKQQDHSLQPISVVVQILSQAIQQVKEKFQAQQI